jgi:Tfp pilus assembly protein PilF
MLRKKVGHDKNLSGFGGWVVRFLTVVTLVLVACAGCGPSEPAKMLAQERWQKASARIKLSLAQQQYDEGRYEQATTTVRQCVQADQQFPLAHLLLGKLLLVQGDVDGATTELKLVLELDAELINRTMKMPTSFTRRLSRSNRTTSTMFLLWPS